MIAKKEMARIACIGFSANDYLIENDGPILGPFLGGSAANVAAILASFGLKVSFVGMVGDDEGGAVVLRELKQFGVDTRAILKNPIIGTPFCYEILETIDDLYVGHTFETSTLDKQKISQKYSRYDRDKLPSFIKNGKFNAIYINKQDPFIFDMYTDDSIIYYEPDYIDDIYIHHKIASMCHVLKYSHTQFADCGVDIACAAQRLVIETFGARGATFRDGQEGHWIHIHLDKARIVDAAGAGDWFSASILAGLLEKWSSTRHYSQEELLVMIRHAMDTAGRASMYRSALGLLRTVSTQG